MASYFDEHNCTPLGEGESPNHMLHMARLLIDTGLGVDMDMDFSSMFGTEKPPPPASKEFVASLPTSKITEQDKVNDAKCPVCLKSFEEDESLMCLPCDHRFHSTCIEPWLSKTNSCPLCRFEMPTDDEDYEEFKRQKQRAKQRKHDLDTLHDSMFG